MNYFFVCFLHTTDFFMHGRAAIHRYAKCNLGVSHENIIQLFFDIMVEKSISSDKNSRLWATLSHCPNHLGHIGSQEWLAAGEINHFKRRGKFIIHLERGKV